MFDFLIGHEEWRKDAVSIMIRCCVEDVIIKWWMGENMIDSDVL